MPRVPAYDRESVALQPLAQRQTITPSGAAAAAGADQLGHLARGLDASGDSADRLAIQAGNQEAFDAEAKAKQAWIEFAADLQKNRQGAGAKGVAADVEKWWNDNGGKFAEGATSSRAQRMVQQSVQRLALQGVNEFKSFELRQGEIAADAAFEANLKASVSAVAANPSPDNMALHRAGIRASLIEHAAARGWSPEVLNDKLATAQSAATIAAFNTIMARNPADAQAFWAANRETVRGEMRDELDTRLKSAVAGLEGEKAVDEVWGSMGPKRDIDPVELDKMAASVRERFSGNPEGLKAAMAALTQRATFHNAAQAERRAVHTNDAMGIYLSTKSLAAVQRSDAFAKLPAQEQARIVDYITNSQTAALNRANAVDQRELLQQQRAQQRLRLEGFGAYLTYSDPKTLAGMSETQVRALLPTLGNELTENLLQMRRTLDSREKVIAASADDDLFNTVAQDFKLAPYATGKNEEQKAQLGAIKHNLLLRVEEAQRAKGKPLDRAEKEALFRGEMAKQVLVKDNNWWFDEKVPLIATTPEQRARVIVPDAERSKAVEALTEMAARTGDKTKYAVTDDNIRALYLTRLARQRPTP